MTDEIPFRVQPMLATLISQPFHKPGWVYEEKYDGFRILAYKEGASVSLLSRNGKDRTQTYPNIAAAIAKLPYRTLLLDGEVVAFDNRRVSRFQLLQEGKVPPLYAVFDCLYENGVTCGRSHSPRGAAQWRRGSVEASVYYPLTVWTKTGSRPSRWRKQRVTREWSPRTSRRRTSKGAPGSG
jgi:hypothetical protein